MKALNRPVLEFQPKTLLVPIKIRIIGSGCSLRLPEETLRTAEEKLEEICNLLCSCIDESGPREIISGTECFTIFKTQTPFVFVEVEMRFAIWKNIKRIDGYRHVFISTNKDAKQARPEAAMRNHTFGKRRGNRRKRRNSPKIFRIVTAQDTKIGRIEIQDAEALEKEINEEIKRSSQLLNELLEKNFKMTRNNENTTTWRLRLIKTVNPLTVRIMTKEMAFVGTGHLKEIEEQIDQTLIQMTNNIIGNVCRKIEELTNVLNNPMLEFPQIARGIDVEVELCSISIWQPGNILEKIKSLQTEIERVLGQTVYYLYYKEALENKQRATTAVRSLLAE